MAQFNIAYAKAHFSELIEEASLGEEIAVTKDNRQVAQFFELSHGVTCRVPSPGSTIPFA